MATGGYKIRDQGGIHFLTSAAVGWVDVFTKAQYRTMLVASLQCCQEHKGLQTDGWCIMSNDGHWMVAAAEQNLSAVLRDFKQFIAYKIIHAIQSNPLERRKAWMLDIFKQEGDSNSRDIQDQFWCQDHHPTTLFNSLFSQQKLPYIHQHPVAAGIVRCAEDYLYSSVRDYDAGQSIGATLDSVFGLVTAGSGCVRSPQKSQKSLWALAVRPSGVDALIEEMTFYTAPQHCIIFIDAPRSGRDAPSALGC